MPGNHKGWKASGGWVIHTDFEKDLSKQSDAFDDRINYGTEEPHVAKPENLELKEKNISKDGDVMHSRF
ncbi:MAG: DUF933 domain-containing protein [Cytophagaceae bacterium]|nr:DUF933 domain-containing protein [Cytophagaceae bacterium]